MNGIEDLKLMLESRSTDYGKMRNILSGYLLNADSLVAKQKTINKELVDENDALLDKLKVAEDALAKLRDRFVSSVHDGTIDPYEALKIAEDAFAAICEKGATNPDTKRNALAELAQELLDFEQYLHDEFKVGDRGLEKAQRIILELAKLEKPIDKDKVKPSKDGRVHFADIVKADEERAFEVLRKSREIAEKGGAS